MSQVKYQNVGLIAIGMMLFIGTAQASAGAVEDIPSALASALGTSIVAAELILSAALLMAAGLTLSVMRKSNTATIIIVELALIGMLTAIGWLDAWLLVMVALVIALIFGSKIRDWGESTFSRGGA